MCKEKEKLSSQKEFSKSARHGEELAKLTGELAHEIKNPLSTVKINLRLIAEELDSAKLKSHDQDLNRAIRKLFIVQQETDRLEGILDGFLKYIGKTELQLSTNDINELVGDVVDFFYPQGQSHNITVRYNPHSEPLKCKLDPAMFKQVLLNLFLNAQHAMDTGGELIVQTSKDGDIAQIQISDTGVGIADDKIDKIFEPFFSTRRGGTGLGLATAKRIIDSHNGQISVHSETGKGTSFAIKLPLVD
jgi:signal transduction histidine kinase